MIIVSFIDSVTMEGGLPLPMSLLIFAMSLGVINGQSVDTMLEIWAETIGGLADAEGSWSNLSDTAHLSQKHLRSSLPPANSVLRCLEKFQTIFDEGGEKTSIILDAMGKPASGILEGNLAWLGDYRQCVDTNGLQHFRLAVNHQTNASLSLPTRVSGNVIWGVCGPSECSCSDISNILHELMSDLNVTVRCDTRTYNISDVGFVATLVIISLLCLVVICATVYDNYTYRQFISTLKVQPRDADEEDPLLNGRKISMVQADRSKAEINGRNAELSRGRRMFLCFSFYSCAHRIMDTKRGEGDITCLHGIRAISMFWIILGHVVSFIQQSQAFENPFWMYTVAAKRFTFQAILNPYSALDTFFLLGGLLAAYMAFKYMSRSDGRVNWFFAILHRYLRIMPAVGMLMLLQTFIVPYFGEGPLWKDRLIASDRCQVWWWTDLLFIQNFVPENVSSGCVSWTWYLATDMQLFIISIPFLILLWRVPVLGRITLSLAVLAGVIIRAVFFVVRDYKALHVINSISPGSGDGFFPFSVKPYICAVPYLVGLMVGFHLSRMEKTMRKYMHPVIVALGWACAFIIGMVVVYGFYSVFDQPGKNFTFPTKTENVFYGSLANLAWAVAVAWVVFACHLGFGGFINEFLSWSFWVPLSRLTFCAYLVHPIVIYVFTGTTTTPIQVTVIHLSILYAGFVTISYAAAFLLSALVEMPIGAVQGILIKR